MQAPRSGPDHDRFVTELGREAFVGYLIHGEATDGPVGIEELIGRPGWMARALCRGERTALFFLERGGDVRPANALCAACVVRSDCLAYALADADLVGTWGGTSGRERRQMRAGRLSAAS